MAMLDLEQGQQSLSGQRKRLRAERRPLGCAALAAAGLVSDGDDGRLRTGGALTCLDLAPIADSRYRKQRGVNLGSLFTLEPWLTPSLFEGVQGAGSEYDLCKQLGEEQARRRLEKHWDTFIDDGDWKWMKGHGINAVRLPISYYHLLPGHPDQRVRALMKGTEYEAFAPIYQNAFTYIQRTVEKAGEHGIGVLLDLHAAPGGQNGEGHSGLSNGKADFFARPSNMKTTISILQALVDTFAPMDNVTGVELINEPHDNVKLAEWYKEAIRHLRTACSAHAHLPLYLGDCWNTQRYGEVVASHKGNAGPLVIDHHLYRCFTPQDHGKTATQHAAEIQPGQNGPSYAFLANASSQLNKGIVIGEWSAALNPASLRGSGRDQSQHQLGWARAQLDAYNALCAGHFFWTLKKEGSKDVGWCLYSAMEEDVLPAGLGRPRQGADVAFLEERGRQEGENNYNGHVQYWTKNSGGKQMHHERYRDGFTQVYRDCVDFYRACGDEIGFTGQWIQQRAHAYSEQHGSSDGEWEFVHGATKAVECFLAALWS